MCQHQPRCPQSRAAADPSLIDELTDITVVNTALSSIQGEES